MANVKLALTIGPKAQAALQPIVDAHNQASGDTLSVAEWIVFLVRARAMAGELVDYTTREEGRLKDEMRAELESLQATKEDELEAAMDLMGV